jgi:hypothetical protein
MRVYCFVFYKLELAGLQAGDSGAVDQRGEAGGEDDAALLPSVPLKPSAAGAEPAGLQPGEFVAAAGVTPEGSRTGRSRACSNDW